MTKRHGFSSVEPRHIRRRLLTENATRGPEQLTDLVLVELTVEITMLTLEPSKAFLGAVYPLGNPL